MIVIWGVFLALALFAFNLAVSRRVWTDRGRTTAERIAEVGLIWCVPVFGGLVALAISAEGPDRVRRSPGLPGSAAGAAATSSWADGSSTSP